MSGISRSAIDMYLHRGVLIPTRHKETFQTQEQEPACDDAKKSELANVIAGYLEVQVSRAAKGAIEDENGGPKREAVGYVYGVIDAALRLEKLNMSDLSVGVPVTFHVLRRLWSDHATEYLEFLVKNIGKDPLVMLGAVRGGQEFVDFIKSGGKEAPMGLAEFLIEQKKA